MPELKMLIGLPASGKTTYAKTHIENSPEWLHLSSDEIAYNTPLLNGEINHQKVFETMYEKTVEALGTGLNVIYDATNLTSIRRRSFLNRISTYTTETEAIIFLTAYDTLKQRNAARNEREQVPPPIIERYIRSFQFPRKDESFQRITVISTKPVQLPVSSESIRNRLLFHTESLEDFQEVLQLFDETRPFAEHDNLHSASFHAFRVFSAIRSESLFQEDRELMCWVALLFAVGKAYVRKRLPYEKDNFYGYEHVSAYLACPLLSAMDFEPAFICDALLLIDGHREAPLMKRSNLKRRIGLENYERLQLFLSHLNAIQ